MSSGQDMPKAYDPRDTEPRWYRFWEERGLFRASSDAADARPPYTIAMPPPNVTGSLHMGHALPHDVRGRAHPPQADAGLQHALDARHRSRRHRDAGRRRAPAQGARASRAHDLGREAFVERVWKWKAREGGRILEQLRVHGRLVRLVARALHDGRGPLARRARGVRAPLRGGAHLPRDAAHQLVRRVPDGAERPRGRERGERTASSSSSRTPSRAAARARGRDDAPRDDARRHGGRGPPGRPALHGTCTASSCSTRSSTGGSRSSRTRSWSTRSSAPAS